MSEPGSMDYLRRPRRLRRIVWYALAAGVLIAVVGGMNAALSRMALGLPHIDRRSVLIDTVQRGDMVHEVRAIGRLAAEDVMWIPAMTDGRVAQIPALPGVQVEPDTVVVVLENPDLKLALAEAESTLSSARALLASERARLQNELLTLEAELVGLRTETDLARETWLVSQSLAERNVITPYQLRLDKLKAEGLKQRLEVETRRFERFGASLEDQAAITVEAVAQAEAALELQKRKVAALQVTAGFSGVLEQVPVEVGQQVAAGEKLARVVDPGRLKAMLRIPEVEAIYVKVGQSARIDTHHGIVNGRVTRIDPGVQQGTVIVDVTMTDPLPAESRPDLSVIGTVEIARLPDVLYVGRPSAGAADSRIGLFRVDETTWTAVRVPVQIGVASVSNIEVREGLSENDRVILTDMTRYEGVDRLQLD